MRRLLELIESDYRLIEEQPTLHSDNGSAAARPAAVPAENRSYTMMVKQARSRGRFWTWLRHVNKASFNRLTLTFAGRHMFALVHHVGRRSGRAYNTPVVAWSHPDGFIMPLPYGADTDWCRNVLATGQCTIQWHGRTYPVTRPEVVATATARPLLPAWVRIVLRPIPVRQFLKVNRMAAIEEKAAGPARLVRAARRRARLDGSGKPESRK
jgi:deazaflavin-dependent oxidoreductase (nitroreductase family)